jgi:hypothetical protein
MALKFQRVEPRPPEFQYETNDCVVTAVAVASEIPYETAHSMLAKQGRKPKDGTYGFQFHPVLDGWCREKLTFKSGMTIGRFAKEHPRGRWILDIASHATTLIDGVVVDRFLPGERCRVRKAWRM